jgi:hypothetical protein
MELEDLDMIVAGTILAGLNKKPDEITQDDIDKSVKIAKRVWQEVLRQQREG